MFDSIWNKERRAGVRLPAKNRHGEGLLKCRCRPRLEPLEDRLAPAAHTWSGAISALWSNPANWEEGSAPSAGETDVALVFPVAAANLANQNDVTGLTVQTIAFSGVGYVLGGNSLALTTSIDNSPDGSNSIGLGIDLPLAGTLIRMHGSPLTLSGVLSGSGGLTIQDGGDLTLSGTLPNTYAGTTTLFSGAGRLLLAKAAGPAVPGPLNSSGVNGGILLLADNQLADGATVALGGSQLDMNGHDDTIGGLLLAGSSVVDNSPGKTSLLRLNGDITAGIFIDARGGDIAVPVSLGDTTRTVNIPNLASLEFSRGIGADSPDAGVTQTGIGQLVFSGNSSNSYTGKTTVSAGTLALEKTGGATAVSGSLDIAGIVQLREDNQIADGATVTLNGGQLDLNNHSDTIGPLNLNNAQVTMGTGTLTLGGDVTGSTGFTINGILALGSATRNFNTAAPQGLTIGAVIQNGGLSKTGAGTLILNGNNTYTGPTTINEGPLQVNGVQTDSPVVVNAGGLLGGVGTVGTLLVNLGGNVKPSLNPSGFTTGSATFNSGAIFSVALNGTTPGSMHDQLHIRGTVTLNHSTLNASLGYPSAVGESFMIIENDETDPVSGTFSGLPQGAILTLNGRPFSISYTGGTGNDVVLTQVQVATGTTVASSISPALLGPAITFTAAVQANSPGFGIPAGTVTFQDGAVTLGTAPLDASGRAQLATSTHLLISGKVTAVYSGGTNFEVSTSLPLSVPSSANTMPNRGFVTQVYRDVLQREVDSTGLAYWSGLLDLGQLTRVEVVQQIQAASEYRTLLVQQLYNQLLQRAADGQGLGTWITFLAQGGTVEEVSAQILGSDEYFIVRGGSTNPGFLQQTYQDALGRAPTDGEVQGWNQQLASGTTRTAVATLILGSREADTIAVQQAFVQFLRRLPDAAGLDFFVNALQAGSTSNEQVIAQLVGSPEYFDAVTRPVSQRFVMHLYQDLLHREADASGLDYWTNQLSFGVLSPLQVVQMIQATGEYRSLVVFDVYAAYLHRAADAEGLSFFADALARGDTVEQVQAALAGSLEYFQTRGGSTTDGFLDALYEDALHRPIDDAARANFTQALASGVTREAVADMLFSSDEYRTVLVRDLYQEFLRRPADAAGLSFWASSLRQGTRQEQVIAGLIASEEYFQRMTNS